MKPSAAQSDVLTTMLRTGKHLVRMKGGFWTYDGCPMKHYPLCIDPFDAPTWSVTVQTVNAMRKRGWIQRPALDFDAPHELTAAGLALARSIAVPSDEPK